MKYATLSDKFAKRMAKGGVVKKFAAGGSVSAAQIQAEIAAGPQTQDALDAILVKYSPAELFAALPQYGDEEAYGRARAEAERREFIAWQSAQPDPTGQGTIGDVFKRQGITDPKKDPRLLAQAQEQIDRATRREDLFASVGQTPGDLRPWSDAPPPTSGDFVIGGGAGSSKTNLSVTPTASNIANTPGMGVGGIGVNIAPVSTTTKPKSDPKRIQEIKDWYSTNNGKGTQADLDKWLATSGYTAAEINEALPQWSEQDLEKAINTAKVGSSGSTPDTNIGAPNVPKAGSYTAQQTQITPGMLATTPTIGDVTSAVPAQAAEATGVAAPGVVTAPTATSATAAPAVSAELAKLQPEQGAVSQQAQITAATQAPETTALAGVQAAQGAAAQVAGAPTRVAQAGEMVAGPTVDMGRVEKTLAATQAAQGAVTEDMTVQGQLNKLLSNFDAGAPPPWAAASMRNATAQLAARGLGASSLAGQAIVQATLEAATPIAAADAKVFEQMGLQNLSNRQQIAVLTGQQRAQFLGQEFDQAFQTRVLNAARVADIADKNFDAQTTIAIENARLTNTMDVANLSARNAVVLAKAAQMSQLETTNLNNRQQAAVDNAKSFLMMDVKNLELRQQTSLFKAQEVADALLSDAALSNAVRITNANNTLEAAKISETLALTASQFNASERNKVKLANMDAANALIKFNAQEANDRQEFNTRMAAEINVVNAKILADVSTANTAAVNAANAVNAKNATELSASVYAQQSQTYRDLLSYSWKTGESAKDRISNLVIASIQKDVANIKADSEDSASWGKAFIEVTKNIKLDDVKKAYDWFKNL